MEAVTELKKKIAELEKAVASTISDTVKKAREIKRGSK